MTSAASQARIHIGSVIRNAAVFDFKKWRENRMDTEPLIQTVARLFALLRERNIEYILVGGIALLQYIEGRNTEDIDLIMALPSLQKLPEITIESQGVDFARGRFGDLGIDILLTSNPMFEKVLRRYATNQSFVEQDIPCASVEGLLLLKLYALPSLYRQGDFARVGLYENDIATLMYTHRPDIGPLFKELTLYLGDTDVSEVRTILGEIQQRIERFGKGFDKAK